MPNINTIIKQLAKEAIAAEKGTAFYYGEVVSESPVGIKISPKITLSENFLVFSQCVTDYDIYMTVEGQEKRKCRVHNKLKTGEKVILGRVTGGQQFIVLGRRY